MPVFTLPMITDLGVQVRHLATKFYEAHPFSLTADEFIESFIDPLHVKTLHQTEEICGRIGNTSYAHYSAKTNDNHAFKVALTFYGESPIIIPQYVAHGLQPTAPDTMRERIQNWIEERWSYGCTFGDAVDALNYLNDVCGDARAFTVMFPVLPTLLRNINKEPEARTSKRAKKLTELRGCGSLPSLPRRVTQRLQEISHLLTAVNMIEQVPTVKLKTGDVMLAYHYGYDVPKREHLFKGLPGCAAVQGSFC